MKKFDRNKIALFLACTSALGVKAHAMAKNKTQIPQSIGAVGWARSQPKKINWKKIVKIAGFSAAGLLALETIHSLIGGFTDSEAGSYSIGRVIRNRVKKNEQLELAKPDGSVDVKKSVEIVKNDDINNMETNDFDKDHEAYMKNLDNLVSEAEFFVGKFEGNAENAKKLVGNTKLFLKTNQFMLNNESVNFYLEIIKKLDAKYKDEFDKALNMIKEDSGFTENQKLNLKDLLQVIRSNRINRKDAETIAVSDSGAIAKIEVTLNSIVYCLELLGTGVSIYKGGEILAYLQW